MNVTHPILKSINPVIKNSSYVATNPNKVKEIAYMLKDHEFPEQRYPFYQDLSGKDIIQFSLVLNAINFQFREFRRPWRKFEVEYHGRVYSGFFALAYSLRNALDQCIQILDAEYLANLTKRQALKFLRGRNIIIPMFRERVNILRDIGKVLLEKYNGTFANFLKISNKAFDKGRGLVEILAEDFQAFNDIRIYRPTGTVVRFYKKAQLLLAILHCNTRSGFKLNDISELTVFADYKLPQALRDLGIIEYSNNLENRINKRKLIPEGSDEEVEIRAHTIYAADLLCKEINKIRKEKITPNKVDEYLWLKGKISKRPRHFTITIHY
jgi:hypothetical protein